MSTVLSPATSQNIVVVTPGIAGTHEVQEVRDIEALGEFRSVWTALLAQTEMGSFFQSLEWLEVYWKYYGEDKQLRVLLIIEDGQPVGILPLVIRREPTRVGDVRLLTYPLDDWSSFYAPIGPDQARILRLGLQHIRRTKRDWDLLDLRWVDGGGPAGQYTVDAMRAVGYRPHRQAWMKTGLLQLAGQTFDEYWASRRKKWRSEVGRLRRKMQKVDGYQYIRYRPRGEADGDCDPRWDLYDACVETASKSWQSSSTNGTTLSHDTVRDFFRDLHAMAVRLGYADLNILWMGDKAAAFNYNVQSRGYLLGYRMGFDPEFARYSPGKVLMAEFVEDGFRRGDQLYDFGHGAFEAKRQWISSIATTYRYTHFPMTSTRSSILWLKRLYQEHFGDEDSLVEARMT